MSKIEDLRNALPQEAVELLDKLIETRDAKGDFIVSAPAVSHLIRTTLRCDIGTDSVWRYRRKHLPKPSPTKRLAKKVGA